MSKRRPTAYRLARGLAMGCLVLVLGLGTGCGGNGFQTDSLASITRRGRGAMDGFVFVPSRARQTATGQAIPHALIEVFVLPRTADSVPIATGQADASGFYRIDGLDLNVPLLIVATDPFDPARQLTAVVSFGEQTEEKRRNLTDASTLAAAILERRGITEPVDDAQVEQIEELADQRLDEEPEGTDVSTDDTLLDELAGELEVESFGEIRVTVYSDPVTVVTVSLNGAVVGTVTSALPPADRSRQADEDDGDLLPNEFEIEDVVIGEAQVDLSASGFVTETARVQVEGGVRTRLVRLLRQSPTEPNRLPRIEDVACDPAFLPFQGGTVDLLARIVDLEGDALRARAIVRRIDPAAREAEGEVVATFALAFSQNLFRGSFDLPGNATTVNQTYTVEVQAIDSAHGGLVTDAGPEEGGFVPNDTATGEGGELLVPHAFTTVQVAGLNPPPPVPGGGPVVIPDTLAGEWRQVRTGPAADQLSDVAGPAADALVIETEGRLTLSAAPGVPKIVADAVGIASTPDGARLTIEVVQVTATTSARQLPPGSLPAVGDRYDMLVAGGLVGSVPTLRTTFFTSPLTRLFSLAGQGLTQIVDEWERGGAAPLVPENVLGEWFQHQTGPSASQLQDVPVETAQSLFIGPDGTIVISESTGDGLHLQVLSVELLTDRARLTVEVTAINGSPPGSFTVGQQFDLEVQADPGGQNMLTTFLPGTPQQVVSLWIRPFVR